MKGFLKLGFLSLSVAIALSGCDDADTNSSNSNNSDNANASGNTQLIEGKLIDGYIAGAHYRCSGGLEGDTDINGTFKCKELPVSFSVGGVKLGEIAKLPADKHVFPQDLVGVDRNKTDDKKVLEMAKFLQSLDSDGNLDDGIEIPKEVKEALKDKTLDLTKDENIDQDVNKTLQEVKEELQTKFKKEIKIVNEQKAKEHLEKTKELHDIVTKLPEDIKKHMETPAKNIPAELKAAIAKIEANKEVSSELYSYLNSALGDDAKAFKEARANATRGMFDPLQALLMKYSVNKDNVAQYKEALKEDLEVKKAEGETSLNDALKVGCKVESKKIDDINNALNLAKTANSSDIFKTLSYQNEYDFKSYKEFNEKLIENGVENGCCSLGDEYCKIDNAKDKENQKDGKVDEGNTTKNPGTNKGNQNGLDNQKNHNEDNTTKNPDIKKDTNSTDTTKKDTDYTKGDDKTKNPGNKGQDEDKASNGNSQDANAKGNANQDDNSESANGNVKGDDSSADTNGNADSKANENNTTKNSDMNKDNKGQDEGKASNGNSQDANAKGNSNQDDNSESANSNENANQDDNSENANSNAKADSNSNNDSTNANTDTNQQKESSAKDNNTQKDVDSDTKDNNTKNSESSENSKGSTDNTTSKTSTEETAN